MFYPLEPKDLEGEVGVLIFDAKERLLKIKEKKKVNQKKHEILRAIIVPHAGYIYSGGVAAEGFSMLSKFSRHDHWKVMLIGPSHHAYFNGAAVSTADCWRTPTGDVQVNRITQMLAKKHYPHLVDLPEAFEKEHSLEVQVPFLQEVLADFSIIPILVSAMDPEKLAAILKEYLDDETIIVVSSDLSHYHSYDEAKMLDATTNKAILDLDLKTLDKKGEACGKTPIMTLIHLAKMKGWKAELIDYKNSGDTSGDKKKVVGYSSFAFYEETDQTIERSKDISETNTKNKRVN
jgi:AmmeMemoRadiSam system protein B